MARDRVYLDHNASTPLFPKAREAVCAALELRGNPSSVHAEGRAARALIEDARSKVASAAGAERKQVVFTGSATEAITQAIVGGVSALGIDAIIVSAGEHLAVLRAADQSGARVMSVGLDREARIDCAALEDALAELADDETALVAIHAVNNETGVVQDLARVERAVGPSRHYLFVDAVQAFGKMPLDFAARATDMMAISAHKMGGPAGVGALLVKSHCDQARLVPGGGPEMGRRGGTEPMASIAGFGAAAAALETCGDWTEITRLTGELEAGIIALAPDAEIFGRNAERLGNVVYFAIAGLDAATAMMAFDLAGIAVSSGSACSSGKVGKSHVLDAMGVPEAQARGALRVSLGWSSTEEDVGAFLTALKTILNKQGRRQGRAA